MQFETLLYEAADGVAVITLNRPERLNAVNGAMSRELPQAWEAVKSDPDVVVAIVTGAGDRALCTGVDVTDVLAGDDQIGDGAVDSDAVKFTAIQNGCWKPVITAVNGMANAGGLHFVTDSDLVVCSENATFFDTHVKVGLVAGEEPVGLARRLPLEAVLRMALLGGSERMDAQRAYQLGLVGDVVPQAQLLPRARELADKIKQFSPTALARSKQAIWGSLNVGLEAGREHAWSIIRAHNDHPDTKEGGAAFAEKRKPRWAPFAE